MFAISVNGQPLSGNENGHEWVDLGLSVKWATCNIGALSPSDYGSYFAWGEINTKSKYTWENYKLRVAGDSYDNVRFSKYNTGSNRGTVDNKKKLEMSDDVARQNWGGSWRIPTDAELKELEEKCTWTWTMQGGKNGYKVTSKTNGNSIFLPAAGSWEEVSLNDAGSLGEYWSSSLCPLLPRSAYAFGFGMDSPHWTITGRCLGFPVRPVTE